MQFYLITILTFTPVAESFWSCAIYLCIIAQARENEERESSALFFFCSFANHFMKKYCLNLPFHRINRTKHALQIDVKITCVTSPPNRYFLHFMKLLKFMKFSIYTIVLLNFVNIRDRRKKLGKKKRTAVGALRYVALHLLLVTLQWISLSFSTLEKKEKSYRHSPFMMCTPQRHT